MKEMAFDILELMHPLHFSITQVEPIWADLNGVDGILNPANVLTRVWMEMNAESALQCLITCNTNANSQVINGPEAEDVTRSTPIMSCANFKFDFPKLESQESFADLAHLLDLDKVSI